MISGRRGQELGCGEAPAPGTAWGKYVTKVMEGPSRGVNTNAQSLKFLAFLLSKGGSRSEASWLFKQACSFGTVGERLH